MASQRDPKSSFDPYSLFRDIDPSLKHEDKPLPPRGWRVILVDDNLTPKDFIIAIMRNFFRMSFDQAYDMLSDAEWHGELPVGDVFTHEIAETKVHQIIHASARHGHTLNAYMEPVS